MTALVQSQHAPAGSGATFTCNIGSAAGNTLVCYVTAWQGSTSPVSVASIADSAGGANSWLYSTAQQSQNPPAAGSYAPGESAYGFSAIGVCLAAAAVTSVTLTLSASTSFVEFGVSEFSGLPAGSRILAAASSAVLATGVSSYSPPALATPATALAVACTSAFNGFTGVGPGGWSALSYSDELGACIPAAAAGTVQPAFTGGSGDVPSSAIIAIGPAAPAPFTAPGRVAGRPAARKGAFGGSAGARYVPVLAVPSPFTAPRSPRRGAMAARTGAARGAPGTPPAPPSPASPLLSAGPARHLWSAGEARQLWAAAGGRGLWASRASRGS